MSPKILIILGSMGRGGAEKVISIIANYYAEKSWDVTIALLLSGEVGYELNPNINIVDLSFDGGSRIKRAPKWIIAIRALIKNVDPDTVISFAARINILTILANLGLNKKLIISERNDPRKDGRGALVRIVTELLYPLCYKIVFQTNRAMKYFSLRVRKKGVVICNPITVDCLRTSNVNNKIVNIGRLTKQKNQEFLIKTFNKIHKKYPEYQLYIYGEGELREELENLINNLDLSDSVKLPGNIKKIHQEICDGKIFVLSSDYEGLSNALLEAMMMGFPVISTNCAGSDEYIKNDFNGILIPVKNEEKLFCALEKMIRDDNYREACSDNAQKTAIKFTKKTILGLWKDIIEN